MLPVFTSVESLLQYRPTGAGYVALPASALFQMAEAGNTAKIAIDPGSPIVAEATPIRIGRPAVPPPSPVLDAVVDALEATPAARRAWLTMLQHGETAPELVIVIRIDAVVGSGQDDIMRSIVDRAGKGSDGVRELRFMRADRDLEQTLDTGAGWKSSHGEFNRKGPATVNRHVHRGAERCGLLRCRPAGVEC